MNEFASIWLRFSRRALLHGCQDREVTLMNHTSWRLCLLLLMAAAFQCLPNTAHANTQKVSCTPTPTGVTFGNIDPTITGTIPKSGNVQFTCRNSSFFVAQKVTLCIGLDQGSGNTITPTRQMSDGTGHDLNFQVYKDGVLSQVWGNVPSTSNPSPLGPIQFTIPAFGSYTSRPYPVYGSLVTPQTNVPVGVYTNNLNGQLIYAANNAGFFGDSGSYPAACDGRGSSQFTLPVQANVPGQCAVSAGSDLNLGSVPSTATNLTGNNSISVTCTLGTPYYIGLSPSNANLTGAGLMSGTGSNTDKVPYQLRSSPGLSGTIWGNTATATSVGNGVAGTGTGNGQSITVYATVPSANYTPDTYTDTVTVYVNY